MSDEIASIIRFILELMGDGITPYYDRAPADFTVDSIYFPQPEFTASVDSTSYFRVKYMWHIKIFGKNSESAYNIAENIALEIMRNRLYIPLYDSEGNVRNRKFAIKEPEVAFADYGVYTLKLNWDSIRSYYYTEAVKTQKYHIKDWFNPDIRITRMVDTVTETEINSEQYDYPSVEFAGEYPENTKIGIIETIATAYNEAVESVQYEYSSDEYSGDNLL